MSHRAPELVQVPRSAAEWYVELDGRGARTLRSDTDRALDASFAEWLTRTGAHEHALERCEAAVALAQALADEPALRSAYADARAQATRLPAGRARGSAPRTSLDWAAAAGLATVAVAAIIAARVSLLPERDSMTAQAVAAAAAIVASEPLWDTAAVLPGDLVVNARALAVLPLAIASEPRARVRTAAFATALDRELTGALRTVPGLYLVNSAAVPTDAWPELAPSAIGTLIGARGIIVGSVRDAGAEIEVDLALLDAASDTVLWQHRYRGRAIVPIMADALEHIAMALVRPVSPAQSAPQDVTSARAARELTSFDRAAESASE